MMLRTLVLLGAGIVAVIGFGPRAIAQASANLGSLDKEVVELVKKIAPAVVRVGQGGQFASGVCVSAKGFVLTDIKVATEAKKRKEPYIDIVFSALGTQRATVYATDDASATALLRIDSKKNFPSARPGNPAELAVGHMLLTIGNSFDTTEDSGPSVTLGVLSGIRRDAQDNAIRLETSAATNPGQEGGPYFNIHGDLIGLEHNLPKDDDLATLTPIDRIVANYAAAKPSEVIFDRPRVLTPPQTLSESMSQGFAIAAKRARKGVVTIVPTYADPKVELPPLGGFSARRGAITGTLVDRTESAGIVVTALAPFAVDASTIDVYAADGAKVAGKLVARDFKSGFAVLTIDSPGNSFTLLPPRPQGDLEIGQFIVVVGAPDGPPDAPITRDGFVTTGILSAMHQLDAFRDALETDAGINLKNAAGAVVDLHGRLVGIAFPPFLPFGQNSGLGFVMPIDSIRALVPRWRAGGTFEPAVLGAMLSDGQNGGTRIDAVLANQPAALADLRAGDLIMEADGAKIGDRQALTDFLMKNKCAGDSVTFTIVRGKDSLTVSLKLGKRS